MIGFFYPIAFAIIWLVDGIKLIFESYCHGSGHKKYASNHDQVTVIVAAYNEEDIILKTIASLSSIVPARNIVIVDDGSKDRTAELIRTQAPEVQLLSIANRGKVGAIHYALENVTTPFVLLMDADTEFAPDFVIPTEALENGDATAVSFNIVPTVAGNSFANRFWRNIQAHEYAKSMQIGRRFSNPTKSVHCISGAAGLFRTDRLTELSKEHTLIFPGEDLERTLLELAADGNVIFSESTVYTDAPQTFKQLSKQRIVGWWPGLWRNIWLFCKLIVGRKEPFRLRYELIYEIFALVTNPLKIISLAAMLIHKDWGLLLFIFINYLLLEIFVYFRIKKLTGKYLKMESLVIGIFTIYSVLQMLYVTFAFFIFIRKKLITKEWKKIVAIATVALFIPLFTYGQTEKKEKKDWTVDYGYSHINDPGKDRAFENHQVYLGYKKIYATFTSAPYNTIHAGGYFGPCIIDARYQPQSHGGSLKIQYEHWFGNFVPHLSASYGISDKSTEVSNPSFPSTGLGCNYYFDDKSNVSLDASKEFGRVYGLTYSAKAKLVKKAFWTSFGASLTNFGYAGAFGQIGYRCFYLQGDYYQHFDFNAFDRASIGAGLKFSF